jgi:hypothetical protein
VVARLGSRPPGLRGSAAGVTPSSESAFFRLRPWPASDAAGGSGSGFLGSPPGYLPLSLDRAPGGANFWVPTSGKAFGYQVVQSAWEGRLGAAVTSFLERASANWAELRNARPA